MKGSLAPDGSVIKQTAVHPAMMKHAGPARVFDSEEGAMQAIMEGYKKGFYPTDPADFFISIGYTDDNGIYQEVPPLRVRAMQGEFLDIGGKIYKVPDFAPAFPGYEKFHPDAYRKNEI